mmetsp:Transcript_112248/g.324242  ORF Transcript_112248/g.324242 Transcript_112248/m.324242 type:complete len:214 (-) Transcript_112248:200-841(-)
MWASPPGNSARARPSRAPPRPTSTVVSRPPSVESPPRRPPAGRPPPRCSPVCPKPRRPARPSPRIFSSPPRCCSPTPSSHRSNRTCRWCCCKPLLPSSPWGIEGPRTSLPRRPQGKRISTWPRRKSHRSSSPGTPSPRNRALRTTPRTCKPPPAHRTFHGRRTAPLPGSTPRMPHRGSRRYTGTSPLACRTSHGLRNRCCRKRLPEAEPSHGR